MDIAGIFCRDLEDQDEWKSSSVMCDTTEEGPLHADSSMYSNMDWYSHWLTPEPYASIDVRTWCLDKCKYQEERDRVDLEINEMLTRDMIPIMRHLIYCVDAWRNNGVFWGVGRGSSVCSFVLYLIGINRINPMEHGLVITEWLKS
jgi:DNA polymerase III alpha subunit